MLMWPIRVSAVVFSVTVKMTLPSPSPDAPDLTVIQLESEAAVHAPVPETVIVPPPPVFWTVLVETLIVTDASAVYVAMIAAKSIIAIFFILCLLCKFCRS